MYQPCWEGFEAQIDLITCTICDVQAQTTKETKRRVTGRTLVTLDYVQLEASSDAPLLPYVVIGTQHHQLLQVTPDLQTPTIYLLHSSLDH